MKKKLWILSFIMAIMFMMAGANLASAYTITSQITSDASSVDIEPGDGSINTVPGMTNWTILGGSSQLKLQWFWFKIADGYSTRLGQPIQIGWEDAEETVPDYGPNPIVTVDSSVPTALKIIYEYNLGDPEPLTFWTDYTIYGGDNPPTGHIHEAVSILNETTDQLSLRLYEYNDFDLLGTPGMDDAVAVSSTQILQYEGTAAIAEVTRSVVLATGHYEIGEQVAILAAVIAGAALNDTPTPYGVVFPGTSSTDTAWAFSWDFGLAANNGSFTISKDKIVVTPVPTTLLLFGSGLFSLIGVGIRRRKS